MNFSVTDLNRDEVQAKYVDSLIAHMDFMQIRSLLRDYLNSEKDRYSNDDLYDEIRCRGEEYISDVFGRGYRYTKIEEEVFS